MPYTVSIHRDSSAPGPPTGAEPPPALLDQMPGESMTYLWHGQRVHYRVLGAGTPLVFVHMPDVGASCLEWRRNTEAFATGYTTIAVDLPGYGMSEAKPEAYTARLYIDFLTDFIKYAAHGAPTDVIGSGLGASYLVHVSAEHPQLIRQMALSAPCGLSAARPRRLAGLAFHALKLPGVSTVSKTGASRTHILEHLQHEVYSDDVYAGLNEVDARFWVAHRPNAEFVERSRLAGLLNTDIRRLVPNLTQRTLLTWGRKTVSPPAEDAELWREMQPGVSRCVFEKSGLCPHEEEPLHYNEVVSDFLLAGLVAVNN